MIKSRRWPRPADSALDRARAIAREYRDALHETDPPRCAALDRAAAEFGEDGWLLPRAQTGHDGELLTLTDLAEALGEKRGTVWAWWHRGQIPREPCGLFRLDEVLDALARRRARRVPPPPSAQCQVLSGPVDHPPVRTPAVTSLNTNTGTAGTTPPVDLISEGRSTPTTAWGARCAGDGYFE